MAASEIDTSTKIIKPPGAITERVAQACDRCRSKKTKCDGLRPQCSNCKIVGLECFMSDKLSRKAYPRGYTELLEERIRELEFQNKKLKKLIDLKDQNNSDSNANVSDPIESLVNRSNTDLNDKTITDNISNSDASLNKQGINIANDSNKISTAINTNNNTNDNLSTFSSSQSNEKSSSSGLLNAKNLAILNQNNLHDHLHDEFCDCGAINRPVSIAGSIDFDKIDLEDKVEKNTRHLSKSPNEKNSNLHLSFNEAATSDGGNMNDFYSSKSHLFNNELSTKSSKLPSSSADKLRNINYSLEQINAPGAAAAISLQKKLQTKNFMNLTNLIASSIPRSTEETLFIPTLMAKIVNVHGFNSKAPYYTSRSIALLKESFEEGNRSNASNNNKNEEVLSSIESNVTSFIKSLDFNKLMNYQSTNFFNHLKLPNQMDMDLYVNLFFQNFNNFIPFLNQSIFMLNYTKFKNSKESNFSDLQMFGLEKFGEILVIIITLVITSREKHLLTKLKEEREKEREMEMEMEFAKETQNQEDVENDKEGSGNQDKKDSTTKKNNASTSSSSSSYEMLRYYDHLIHELINSNMNSIVSISSLQLTTLELFYCLITGDLHSAYQLRGKLITMSQQLRLHRCPTAVLGSSGSNVSKLQQGERRILFWCIYILDSFSALILGVPRLLKDFEIECALPSSLSSVKQQKLQTDDETDVNSIVINNSKLSLAGKVSDLALAVMRYSKIQGLIVDHIFKRSNNKLSNDYNDIDDSINLLFEDLLESWRKNLKNQYFFEIDTNGNISREDFNKMNENQLILSYLYYQSKLLIYMPLMTNSRSSSSFIIIQQTTTILLSILSELSSSTHNNFYILPIPNNIPRQKARLALLSAKNALEYTRSGNLFKESKTLIESVIQDLTFETEFKLLGCLSTNCVESLQNAVSLILSVPKSEMESGNTTNSNMGNNGLPSTPSVQSSSAAQSRRRMSSLSNSTSNSTPAPKSVTSSIPASQLNNFNVKIKKEKSFDRDSQLESKDKDEEMTDLPARSSFTKMNLNSNSNSNIGSNNNVKIKQEASHTPINDIFSSSGSSDSQSHSPPSAVSVPPYRVGSLFQRNTGSTNSQPSSTSSSATTNTFLGQPVQQQPPQPPPQQPAQQQRLPTQFQPDSHSQSMFQQYQSPSVPVPQDLQWSGHNTAATNGSHGSSDFLECFFKQSTSPAFFQDNSFVPSSSTNTTSDSSNPNINSYNNFPQDQQRTNQNINSYSDLFVLNSNDFAVDGSIGLQLLDFELNDNGLFDDRPNKMIKREQDTFTAPPPSSSTGGIPDEDEEYRQKYYHNSTSTTNSRNNQVNPLSDEDTRNQSQGKKPNLFNWS